MKFEQRYLLKKKKEGRNPEEIEQRTYKAELRSTDFGGLQYLVSLLLLYQHRDRTHNKPRLELRCYRRLAFIDFVSLT